jgi:hypothetical protein
LGILRHNLIILLDIVRSVGVRPQRSYSELNSVGLKLDRSIRRELRRRDSLARGTFDNSKQR